MWCNRAADGSPNVGRIQHHLAVLARPNVVQQLFYCSKVLVSVIPSPNARESIMLHFNSFLEGSQIASQRYPLVESAFINANGILFTQGSILNYTSLMDHFCSTLDNHIGCVTAKLRVQSPESASSLCAATFDFENPNSYLLQAFNDQGDQWRRYVEPDDSLLSALYRIRAFWGKDILSKSHQVKNQSLKDPRERRHDDWKRLLGIQMKDSRLVEIFEELMQPIYALQMAGFPSCHHCTNHGTHPVLPLQHFSPNGTLAGQTEITYKTQGPNIEPDAKKDLRACLRSLALRAELFEAFTKFGRAHRICQTQSLNSGCYWRPFLHAERSFLRRAGASLEMFQAWTCSTFSAFMRHGSMTMTMFFLARCLPTAYAAPTGTPPTTGDPRSPNVWLDFGTICHILGWAVGALVVYLGVRGPKRDLARYYVLSFGSTGVSLVLLDPRSAAAVQGLTLFVGIIFLIRLWLKISELYKMGYGWLGPIFGLAVVFDTILVHLTVSTSGEDQGLFFQLLLLCFCSALSLCARSAQFVRHVRSEDSSRLEDGRRPNDNSGPGLTMEDDDPSS